MRISKPSAYAVLTEDRSIKSDLEETIAAKPSWRLTADAVRRAIRHENSASTSPAGSPIKSPRF
jgi:hypothetical protein